MATPKLHILTLNMKLMKVTDQFLETKDWINKSISCRFFKESYQKEWIATLLMDLVLNINIEKREKILKIIAENPELILIQTRGNVKYCSSQQNNEIIARIRISNFSPLQAAALSGNFHLVNIFRDTLPNKLKHQAGLQLDTILSRPDFLAPFKALKIAFHELSEQFKRLEADDWTHLDELYEQVGQAQKGLSTFGLQVFCNPAPPYSLPDFTKEPLPACRFDIFDYQQRKWTKADGDLDSFGFGTYRLLSKSGGEKAVCISVRSNGDREHATNCALWDHHVVSQLCDVITEQLSNTKTLLLEYAPDAQSKQAPMLFSSTKPLVSDKEKESDSVRVALS